MEGCEMLHWAKVLVTKPEYIRSILKINTVEEETRIP